MKQRSDFDGSLKGNFSSDFRYGDLNSFNLSLFIDDLYFRKDKLLLFLKYPHNEIEIKKGNIEKLDILLRGGESFLRLSNLGKKVKKSKLNIDSKLNLNLLEMFFPVDSGFKIGGDFNFSSTVSLGDFKMFNYSLSGSDAYVFGGKAMMSVSDVAYSIFGDGGTLVIENIKGKYFGGDLSAQGTVDVSKLSPVVDLNLSLSDANINFMSQSSASLSFHGVASGKKPPYNLSGLVEIDDGKVYESIGDYYKALNSSSVLEKKTLTT